MKKYAIAAALLVAACATKPPPAPPPVSQPQAKMTPRSHPHDVAPRPEKPESPPPPYAIQGPLTRELAGAYMDGQEAELRQRLRGSGVQIFRLGDTIDVIMPLSFLFDDRLQGVSWDGSGALSAIASVVQEYDRTAIQIGGYTDTTGSAQSNQRVSDSRAKIVADVLARDGVPPGRISARGYGETHLLVPTGDNVNQPRNRRVEIRIVPKIDA